MSILPQNGGLGLFSIDPNATPDQIAKKRALIAAMMPQYGKARYVGEGIGQLATGIATGMANRKMDKFEADKRAEASEAYRNLVGGGPLSVLGMKDDWGTTFAAQPSMPAAQASPTADYAAPAPVDDTYKIGIPISQAPPRQTEQYPVGVAASPWAGKEDIQAGIFAGESGGDYDALFGFSNREGPFSNVKLTDMTVGQAMQFSDPSGPYGQWVKGKVGRVATPMGAYQVVGSTLRDAVKAGAVSPSEPFNKEAQDRLGAWILKTQGTDAWEGYRGPQVAYRGPQVAYNGPSVAELSSALSNPWLSQEERGVVGMMLQQAQQANDPMRAMEMERAQLELEQLRNPKPKQTATMQEYDFARSQGYEGTFTDYKRDMAAASATNVSTTVNTGDVPDARPMADKPEKGYQRRWDEDRRTWVDEPIPGGQAERDVETADKKSEQAMGNAMTASDVITTAANRARDAAKNQAIGSYGTSIVGMLPWTDSAEVVRQVDVLKSNAKIENLTAMRAASPTGGALGSVTEKESDMLAAKAGALDPNSPTFLRDLEDYERTLLRTIHGPEMGDRIFEETRQDAEGWTTINGVRVREKR